MPYGHDINSNDPTVKLTLNPNPNPNPNPNLNPNPNPNPNQVKRAVTLAFRTEPLGNTVYGIPEG